MHGMWLGLRGLRAGLLASVCLGAVAAHATDGTWLAAPADGNWNNPANWTSSPAVPDGTATFGQSTQTAITFSVSPTTVQTIQFTQGAPQYTFDTGVTVNVTGTGIFNASTSLNSPIGYFTFTQTGNGALNFFGSASASKLAIDVKFGTPSDVGTHIINIGSGLTSFFNTSTAGFAFIQNLNGGTTTFTDTSNAGSAEITNDNNNNPVAGSLTFFFQQSNAGNALIGNTRFGGTIFNNNSSAANAIITNDSGGGTIFQDQSKAGSARIDNNAGGVTRFFNQSSADQATITNNGGTLEFHDQTTAGNAIIVNNSGGLTHFMDQSTGFKMNITNNAGGNTIFDATANADAPAIINSTITNNNGGSTFFRVESTAGLARLINNAGGVIDISGLTDAGMTAGSIEGAGTVFLGSKRLVLGGNNFSTEVSGRFIDGGVAGGTGGSLVKVGSGTLILSGNNGYTGVTLVNEGALVVNGSIASSLATLVSAGALLGGNGIVGNTIINGGILSPGNSVGTLTVQGSLALTAASTYLVEVASSGADRTSVSGTAVLGGSTVQAVFLPNSSLHNSYTIVSAAGGRGGTFGTLTTSGLPVAFSASLNYTSTDALLNLTANLGGGGNPGIANTLNNFFNSGGTLPAGFVNLFNLTGSNLTNALSQLSGEAATDAQVGAFKLMDQFLALMLDPFVDGRSGIGGGPGGPALGFAPERPALPDDIALAYANVLKAPARPPLFEQRWTVWGGSYGASNKTSGDPGGIGSHDLSARAVGFAAGLDYQSAPGTVVGFALAGAGTGWSLAQGLGSGRSDAFQAGIYGATRSGPGYLAASAAYTNHWMSTDRFAVAGDHLTADFVAQNYGARVEGGYRFGSAFIGVTPYAAAQVQSLRLPGYSETDANGVGFALSYQGRTATDTRSELGARFDQVIAVGPAAVLTLRSRLAWAHDWVTDPNLVAAFQTLPGTSFIVSGASPVPDSALVSAGSELRFRNGISLLAKFDGEFARRSQTYGGTGTIRYTW
jgi:autotransporter-associated beta strand protein